MPDDSPPVTTFSRPKPIGSYLVDAGLLTSDQISVILADQQATGMRFGDIAVTRGWVKEQTIEWVMRKVVEPERTALQSRPSSATPVEPSPETIKQETTVKQPYFRRRDLPISKPLPSVKSADNDVVNWVG